MKAQLFYTYYMHLVETITSRRSNGFPLSVDSSRIWSVKPSATVNNKQILLENHPPLMVSPSPDGITLPWWYHPPLVVSPSPDGITLPWWYHPPLMVLLTKSIRDAQTLMLMKRSKIVTLWYTEAHHNISCLTASCQSVSCLNGRYCVLDQNHTPHCVPCRLKCPPAQPNQQICGSDGNTYDSLCKVRAAMCLRGKSIAIAYRGPCIRKYDDSLFVIHFVITCKTKCL
jgi:hypothetical protein